MDATDVAQGRKQAQMDEFRAKMEEFQSVTKPIIKWLNDNHHPHMSVLITPTGAELLEGNISFQTEEFWRD